MKNRGISIFVYSILFTTIAMVCSSNNLFGQDEPNSAFTQDPTTGCISINVDPAQYTPSANPGGPGCANNPSWAGNQQPDVWVLINVPSTGVLFLNPSGTVDAGMAAYTFNAATNTYTLLDCDDDTGPGLMPQITVTQTAGTPIYVQLWAYGGGNISFSMCSAECASPQTYSPDADGDGYGETGVTVSTCNPEPGWVTNSTDCNDQCGTVYTGMTCDDGNPETVGDVILGSNCMCQGTIPTLNDCIPGGAESFTFTPAAALAAPVIGTSVQICYEIDWQSMNGLWMDGIQFQLGPGWTAIAQDVLPANCGGGGGNWVYSTTINPSTACGGTDDLSGTNNTVGYYFDYNSSGSPGTNWGDGGSCTFTGCITATINSANIADLNINVLSGGDNVFGSYGGGCGECVPSGYSYPPPTVGTAPCGINLPICVTPSLCDETNGLITIDNTNQNFVSFFNPPASGNLIIEVNGQLVQSFPAPFVGSPLDIDFTMYANGSATNAVTAHFDALPTCTATSNLVSPAACGCLVEFQSVTATCQPMPVGGSGDNYYDVEVDLNVNALPIGSTLTMEYECGGTQPWLINNNLVMTTINDNPWSFGVFAPLNTQGALALSSDALCDITFTIVDAGGNDLSGICTLPAPETVTIPQIELVSPLVTNCSSTAQGSAFDVALTANISGFDLMSANNTLSFFNNGTPIAVSVNGNIAANTFDLSSLPAGTTTIDLDYSNIVYNDVNALTFSISDGACDFNALVNETDPATAAVLANAFNFTINNTAGNPFFSEPCTCQITNLQVTNATPECIGYGNFFELEVSFDFAYPPNGVAAHVYYTSTLDTIANPVFTKNTLNQYPTFSNDFTTGNFPALSYFAQIPTPPVGVGLTQPYTNNLVVDFEYPNGTGLTCSAVVPFTLPGACNCDIVDMGTFSPAVTPNAATAPNQLVLCPNDNIDFVSNNNFTPPAIAFEEIAPNNYQPIPDDRALGLILVDPTTGQQILWDYQLIDFSGVSPSIANPLSIDNTFNGTNYPTQDQIITLLNSANDPLEMPLTLNARIVTIYNVNALLGPGGNVPMIIPASEINAADPVTPYSGNIFATGVEPFLGNLTCGGFTTDWELIFTPLIQVENITPDCPSSSLTFDVHAGSYPFNWSAPVLNSGGGAIVNINDAANANPANITYSGLTTGYVLDITLEDIYGCTIDQTFNPFVAPTIGQISLNELGGNPVLLPSSPNQTIRCGTDPNFQLVGQWENAGNSNAQAGEWEIIWNGSTFTGQLSGYFNPGPGNIGIANAIDFNQLYSDLLSDGLLNTNTSLFPANQPLYFSFRFNPTVSAPGCSEWSDEYQIAFLDNFIPQAVLLPAGTDAVSKCVNEAEFDLSAIGGLPLNGAWHIGPIDPLTNTGAQDFIIENGSTFDLSNVTSAGLFEAYYDVAGVAGVECPVLSNDFITITVHDTTDAVISPDLFEDCMPQADFVLSNVSDLINGTTDCKWYLDDVLQTAGDCNSINLALMMPKTYDITLTITDINGCIDTTRYEDLLEVHPQPEVAFLYNPQSVTMDDPEFQFLDNSTSPLVSYSWNFANYGTSTEPYTSYNFSEVTEPGSYDVVLIGTDANQCSTEVSRQVMIEEGFVVFMPSSFTPDDDNLNEALRPVISGSDRIRFYKFVVFDRWGNIVFETNDYKEWWIGDNQSMTGYYVPNGSYQWRMEVILEGLEDRKIYKGAVTIIR